MRKTIIASNGYALAAEQLQARAWLDLDTIGHVEMSSEDPQYPAEWAFTEGTPGQGEPEPGRRWQAAKPGPQTLTVRFDTPQAVRRVLLRFHEEQYERSQEFRLSAAMADGQTREVVRQQWNFSPDGSAEQLENYAVNLHNVAALTLWIDPDRGRDRYPATLSAFRVEG